MRSLCKPLIFAIVQVVSVMAFAQVQTQNSVCQGEPFRVLLTAFEPFGGRKANGSQVLAGELQSMNLKNPCVQYDVCNLPVEYERGSQLAMDCYNQSNPKPHMVISMGEGGCNLRLETKAHNLNDTPGFPDNAGEVRTNQIIDENPKAHELLTLPIPSMYCAGEVELGPPSQASISPGYYICNDVAYRMARELKPLQVPFGFIHVPIADSCNANFKQAAEKVNVMVWAAIRALSVPTSIFSEKFGGDSSRFQFVESNYENDSSLVNLNKVVTPACRAKVLNKLRVLSEKERNANQRKRGDI